MDHIRIVPNQVINTYQPPPPPSFIMPPASQMSANDNEFVRALIDMYRSLPCLWKIKSADYSNRNMKRAAYEKLVALHKEHHPTESVDETIVRKKIQALRTVYKKELNKVEKSKKSGAGADDVYVPKLWYFDLLAFTRDQEIPRPAQTVTSHQLKSLLTSMCLLNSSIHWKGPIAIPLIPPQARVLRSRQVKSGHVAKERQLRANRWISWHWPTI
ncbi:unnamed protein product [Ranitomeya imitator]|nr:unnamed protein product [Ranitomeya imitator]